MNVRPAWTGRLEQSLWGTAQTQLIGRRRRGRRRRWLSGPLAAACGGLSEREEQQEDGRACWCRRAKRGI